MTDLRGHVALVTGCGRPRGLGRTVALELARAGAHVAVADHPRPSGAQPPDYSIASLAEEIGALGVNGLAVIGDVGSPTDVERMVDEASSALGQVDIVVNNAAAPHGADRDWTWHVPPEAWEQVLRTNATGAFLVSSAVVRHLLEVGAPFGRIVNIASAAGLRGLPQRAAYSASKFAMIGLTQAMAWELVARGITVNAVCPGTIVTDRQDDRGGLGTTKGDIVLPRTPAPRLGQPFDVARAVLFLADPSADFVTGQAISVDGGFSLV